MLARCSGNGFVQAIVAFAFAFSSNGVQANPVILNSGFESRDVPNASSISGPMTDGWFFSSEASVVDPDPTLLFPSGLQHLSLSPVEGEQFAKIDKGYIEQTISGFAIGVPATLSYMVSGSYNTFGFNAFEEYQVLANGDLLAALTTTTLDSFTSHSIVFVPTTTSVTLRFETFDPSEHPIDPDEFPEEDSDLLLLDKIEISQVPEASTCLLTICGAAVIAAVARRKRVGC